LCRGGSGLVLADRGAPCKLDYDLSLLSRLPPAIVTNGNSTIEELLDSGLTKKNLSCT